MMITIIPAKPLYEAKTRLAAILSLEQRAELGRRLLLRAIRLAAAVSPVLVVSRDEMVARIAGQIGAAVLTEQGADLNLAVEQGLAWAQAKQFKAALVLPIDLPYLSATELQGLIKLGRQTSPNLVIAPCRRNEGTNALFLSPPDLIAPQFGPASFLAHQQAALAAGLRAQIYRSPGFAFDLDIPEDWEACVLTNTDQILTIA